MNEPPPAWAGRAEAGERGTSVSTWEEAGMSLWVTALRANPVKFTAAAASESFPPPGGCSRQFPLEMLPGIPYGDVPGNSLWGCSRKFPLGMLTGILYGDAPENSPWGCSRQFSMGMLPAVPSGSLSPGTGEAAVPAGWHWDLAALSRRELLPAGAGEAE